MAENLDININAKDNASRTIDNVKKNIQGLSTATLSAQKNIVSLNTAFTGLRNVLGTIAIGSFINSAFNLADAMSDLSDATNLSLESVLGFSQALSVSGGNFESAGQNLTRFTQTLGSARDGSQTAIQSFGRLGISLNELRTLSE